jgi:O-antigen/teichoic acid export membrane protein
VPSLLKNFSFLTASGILMPFASMALVVTISRLGGVEMLGDYTILLTFFFIGQTCSTAGVQILITREVARERDKAGAYLVSGSVIGVMAAGVISLILIPSFTWSVPGVDVRLSLVLMGLALFPTTVIAFAESVLLAFEHAEDFVVVNFIETVVRTISGTIVLFLGYGIIGIAASFLACRLLAAWASVWRIRYRDPNTSMVFDRACFRDLLRHVPVVGSIPILNALYWRLDTMLLTWMRGIVDVGFYGASTRILDITRNLPQAYARALYPVLSRASHAERSEFERLSRDSLIWIVVATIPISLGTYGLAHWIIAVLYGPSMTPAVRGLQIVAWLIIPYSLTSTLAQILFASGQQALDLRVNAISVVVNTCLNLLLIPRAGFVGASMAALLTISLHVTLQYRYVRSRVFDPGALGPLARVAAVTLISFLVLLAGQAHNPFAVTTLGIACYGLGLWLMGVVEARHVMLVWDGAVGFLRARSRVAPLPAATQPPVVK